MEFYPNNRNKAHNRKAGFQFPTGWNSTLLEKARVRSNGAVSIPNGMEFYAGSEGAYDLDLFKFQFPTGWNSTKQLAQFGVVVLMFQFPTGWNSTVQSAYNSGENPSFNSQRDGILPNA